MNKRWEVTYVQYSPPFTCIIIVHLVIAPQDRCFHNPHLTRVRKVSEFLRSQSLDRVELEPTEVFFSTTVPAHGGIRKDPGPTDPNDQNLRHHSAPRRPLHPLRCLPALCPPPAILSLHLAHPSRPTCQMPPPPWSNSWSLHVDLGLLNHYLKYLLLYIHLPSTTKWWVFEDTRHGSEPQPRAHAASHK